MFAFNFLLYSRNACTQGVLRLTLLPTFTTRTVCSHTISGNVEFSLHTLDFTDTTTVPGAHRIWREDFNLPNYFETNTTAEEISKYSLSTRLNCTTLALSSMIGPREVAIYLAQCRHWFDSVVRLVNCRHICDSIAFALSLNDFGAVVASDPINPSAKVPHCERIALLNYTCRRVKLPGDGVVAQSLAWVTPTLQMLLQAERMLENPNLIFSTLC